MLAYVFWHQIKPGFEPARYERMQADFHTALGQAGIPGLTSSSCHRVMGAAWLDGDGWYEDWYLVTDSAGLDPLNQEAVGARMRVLHDAAAEFAGAMTAGLYRHVAGAIGSQGPVARWFGKPDGTTYPVLYATLTKWTERPGYGLWRRNMVLGPTPEFCLLGPGAADPDLGQLVNRSPIE